METLDFVSLRLVASVVEHGNIAQASRINNIAASAISKRISNLEDSLGVPLIHRLRDGVKPTSAGEVLYRHVQGVNQMMGSLHAEMSDFTKGERGRIRLWANTSSVIQFLPEDLKVYLDQRPEVRIELREANTAPILEAIRDGRADLGIFSGLIGETDVEHRVYRRDTLMLVVPKSHPLAGQKRVSLTEAAQFDHVGLQPGSSLQGRILEEARLLDIEIRMRVHVFSFDGIRGMVEAGLGVAILPQGAVLPYLDSHGLAAIELDEPWATRTLYLGFKDYRELPIIVRQLISTLSPSET
jgi:DNA-binding transcriptional LysR family regulator